jgi:hypothetical protein
MPRKSAGHIIIATIVAMATSAFAFLIGVLAGIIYGRHFMNGEAAAWSGMSVGFPLGLILSVVTGPWVWVRVLKYNDPPTIDGKP